MAAKIDINSKWSYFCHVGVVSEHFEDAKSNAEVPEPLRHPGIPQISHFCKMAANFGF